MLIYIEFLLKICIFGELFRKILGYMKKTLKEPCNKSLVFSLIFCLLTSHLDAEKLSVAIESEAAILINAKTGAILFEKNSHKTHFPASITKIATALYALKVSKSDLSTLIAADQESIASIKVEAKKRANYTTPSYWIEHASTHMGIKKDEEFTFKDLLFGVLLVSANDASNVVARHAGGTIPKFIKGLNAYLKILGCKQTNFTNPHGLHHPNHITTTYDMAIIAREAMKNPTIREIVATVKFVRPKTNKQDPTVILQKNRLLRSGKYHYPKAIGIKTGFTSIARHNLVAAAKDGDRELIVVLMKCEETGQIYNDAIKLFDAAFNQPKMQKIVFKAGPQKFKCEVAGANQELKTYIKNDLAFTYYPAEEPVVKCYLQWQQSLKLPIMKDQQVGELQLKTVDGQLIQKLPLYAMDNIKESWFHWIKQLF